MNPPILAGLLVVVVGQADPTMTTGTGAGETHAFNQLITLLTIFALAIFVGFEIITKVPPTLHTPLMSGSNAISGITIIGALIVSLPGAPWVQDLLALLAVSMATINVVGGYLVTDRMLAMFRGQKR